MFILSSLLCFALISLGALGSDNELRIYNENEFITFLKSSSPYSGTTVYLESDLDFTRSLSNEFEPKNSFSGVFDGQGHVISNLVIKSSSNYVGLFGEPEGSIKNIIMDSSCSFTSNFTGDANVHIGSIFGFHEPDDGNSIYNIVNMANVTFEGNTTGSNGFLFIGGIAGVISPSYEITVKNCVNYGFVKHSGVANSNVYTGGIVGQSYGSSLSFVYIYNCLNYGIIIVDSTSGDLCIGGISGFTSGTSLVNCVNAGIIMNDNYKGGIVGRVKSSTDITHCLWTSDTGCDDAYMKGTPLSTANSSLISVNSTTVNELNELSDYAGINYGWNKWVFNHNNVSVTFTMNNRKEFSVSSQLILLPSFFGNGYDYLFDGWYTDPYCSEPFESTEATEETTLYGLYGEIIAVSFNANEGSVVPSSKKVVVNSTYAILPVPRREGYSFIGWFTDNNENVTKNSIVSISNGHILTAQWKEIENKKYTVTFDLGNGTKIENALQFNEVIVHPDDMIKEGYAFNGWVNDTEYMPAHNLTITAQWIPNNYTVTFDFKNGTLIENVLQFNDVIIHPENVIKEGYIFSGWVNDTEYMPAHNITITPVFIPSNYTVTFNVNGGNELNIKEKTVTFNNTYGTLPTPNRTGYTFIGWFNKGNESVSDTTIVSIAVNHTLYAQWKENRNATITQVEIVFGTKDLTEDDIKHIVEQYTDNDDFEIVAVVESEFGEMKVIIKFIDVTVAQEFVRKVKESNSNTIKRVGIVNTVNSFSFTFYPTMLFSFLLV